MRLHHAIPVLLVAAAPLAAQNARDSIQVDPTTNTIGHPSIDSEGGLTAFAYVDDTAGDVYVVTSNDGGLSWSAPTLISSTAGTKELIAGSVHVIGDQVFVGWENDPGTSDVYFNYFDGNAWTGEQFIDKGAPAGMGEARDFRMDVAQGNSDINVVFAFGTEFTSTDEDLYVTSSQDGGATFGSAVYVPTDLAGINDVDDIALTVDGDDAYVVWADNRLTTNDIFLQKSTDGGATWTTFVVEKQLDTDVTGDVQFGIVADANNGNLAVAWNEERPDGGNEQLRGQFSSDGGTTILLMDVLIGGYTPVTDDTDNPDIRVNDNGTAIVAWEDNRSGSDEVYVARSTDLMSYGADTLLSDSGGGFPRLEIGAGGDAVASWSSGDFPNTADSAYTTDDGANWTFVQVSDNTGDVDFAEVTLNASQENVIVGYLSDDTAVNAAYAGGYAICGGAANASRNAGSNPASLTSNSPILGGTFMASVDLNTTGHNFAVVLGYGATLSFTLGGGQVILTDITDAGGELFNFTVMGGPIANFSIGIPNDPALCGAFAAAQAIHVGGVTPFALSNAQDLTAGAL